MPPIWWMGKEDGLALSLSVPGGETRAPWLRMSQSKPTCYRRETRLTSRCSFSRERLPGPP